MADTAFHIWTDYLGLIKVVEGIIESRRRLSRMEAVEGTSRSGLFDKQSWKVVGNSSRAGRSDLKDWATPLQHKAAARRRQSLTMEIGTGLLMLNSGDVEKMHCEEERESHHLLDDSVESQLLTSFMNRDSGTERQPGVPAWQSSRQDALAPSPRGAAAQRHDLPQDLFQSTARSGKRKEVPELSAAPGWGGSKWKCNLTGAQSVGRVSRDSNICTFCKQNGESKKTYASHALKDAKGKVVCPILRGYTCPLCNTTGDNAHTKRFCHLLQGNYKSMYQKASKDMTFIKAVDFKHLKK